MPDHRVAHVVEVGEAGEPLFERAGQTVGERVPERHRRRLAVARRQAQDAGGLVDLDHQTARQQVAGERLSLHGRRPVEHHDVRAPVVQALVEQMPFVILDEGHVQARTAHHVAHVGDMRRPPAEEVAVEGEAVKASHADLLDAGAAQADFHQARRRRGVEAVEHQHRHARRLRRREVALEDDRRHVDRLALGGDEVHEHAGTCVDLDDRAGALGPRPRDVFSKQVDAEDVNVEKARDVLGQLRVERVDDVGHVDRHATL